MKRLALLALLAACVPAEEERLPRGAAGVQFQPGASALGTPFTTSDGWTVRVTYIGLVASVSLFGERTGGRVSTVRLDGTKPAETCSRAMGVGPVAGKVEVTPSYEGVTLINDYDACASAPVLGDELRARFDACPANGFCDEEFSLLPGLVLGLEGSRGTERVRLDLSVAPFGSESDAPTFLSSVKANDVTYATVVVEPSRLFEGPLRFDAVVEADRVANHDGIVTAAELRSASVDDGDVCADDVGSPFDPGLVDEDGGQSCSASLLDLFVGRANVVLQAR